jgi:hypothetical protein
MDGRMSLVCNDAVLLDIIACSKMEDVRERGI